MYTITKTYDDKRGDELSKVADADLSSAIDGGKDDLSGLTSKGVDLGDGARDDGLEVVDKRSQRLDSAVLRGNVVWMTRQKTAKD